MSEIDRLGPEVENAVRHLLRVYDLSTVFEPCVVISPHPQVHAELRHRLAEKTAHLELLEPGEDFGERVRALMDAWQCPPGGTQGGERQPGEPRPVVWLQQQRFDAEGWMPTLTLLQRQRELYRERAPWMWILAGPPALMPLLQRAAMHILSGVTVRLTLEDPSPFASGPLRWLHLSDFHFRAQERWEQRATLQALLRHVEEHEDRGLAPDLVFVTGDIAFSGKKGEYDQAHRFFAELAKVLDLEPRERFFFVPGNHDIDRGAIRVVDRNALGALTSQDDIEEIFNDPDAMTLIGRRLEGFYAFTERFLGTARAWHPGCPWRVNVLPAGGVDVAVMQLNSAWASGEDDTAGLLVGETQVRQALEEAAGSFLRVVLVHHPLADLQDFDRQRLETLYAAEDVHFVLRGHLHRNRTEAARTPDGVVVELAAGAIYPGGDYEKAYLLTETDLEAGRGRVHFYRYSDAGRGFWVEDNLTYEKTRHGVWTLDLPESLKLDAGTAPAVETEMTAERHKTLAARYREAVAAVHGTVRFVGFADHRPRPYVRVLELFVPLRLEEERTRMDDDPANQTSEDLLRGLAEHSEDGAGRRFVVLGDPGSGKTTLCQFAAMVLADKANYRDVKMDGDILPLFLPFRDYVHQCRERKDRSLLEFLADQTRNHLQVKAPDDFIERALEEGRAVLLLDGLDEVGSAADRQETRDRVQGFCSQYPRVSVLVTSRIAGYEEAPLPRHGDGAFVHLRIAPFNDADLKQFVTSWYTVQEHDDPVERDRGVKDLLGAFESNERVRELARNPMLATQIALVHRFEAHLPGERAALYDICVKTLLVTRPAARRKTFIEIDTGLQRAYLETLALQIQTSRFRQRKEIIISRAIIIDALMEIMRQQSGTCAEPETARELIERWVLFLVEGTGLLMEQRPGAISFLHLSLLEYLAARGMAKAGDLADAVSERFDDVNWREVCLLAVGDRATDKVFLDQLFRKVRTKKGSWFFLLRCLREEAAFDDKQKSEIVRGASQRLLELSTHHWKEIQDIFADILHFSRRHAGWADSWIAHEVRSATGESLQATVALRFQDEGCIELLQQRTDAESVAADLLDFWPESRFGGWAASTVKSSVAFNWGRNSPTELLIMRSFSAMQSFGNLSPGLMVEVLRQTSAVTELASAQAIHLEGRECFGSEGLPASIKVEPKSLAIDVLPADCSLILRNQGSRPNLGSGRHFTHNLAQKSAQNFTPAMFGLSLDSARELISDLDRYLMMNIPRNTRQNLDLKDALKAAFDSSLDYARSIEKDFSAGWISQKFIPGIPNPEIHCVTEDVVAFQEMTRAPDRETSFKHWRIAFTRLSAEALIGLISTIEASTQERLVYIHYRLRSAHLLQTWLTIDDLLPENPDPRQLALYLTLGFSQATTTWQWPATERWITLLGGEPPSHWLPRILWYLCWRLHDPGAGAHREGIVAALDEGLKDPEMPWVAEELRRLLKTD